MKACHLLVGFALAVSACGGGPGLAGAGPTGAAVPGAEASFESWWRDGQAEVSGYRLRLVRYGQERTGTAVAIYVTEPWSESLRVKVDDASAHRDAFEALKLNLVRDFQTGIYDYNTMTSLFVRARDLSPVAITFSSAEWCGHVFERSDFYADRIAQRYDSYFEGESGERALARPTGGIAEEELYVKLRGLRGAWIEPGASREVPFLPAAFVRRLTHTPSAWETAGVSRAREPERVEVPAGAFETTRYEVATSDGRRGVFWVEAAYPHRIVRWEWRDTGGSERRQSLGSAGEVAEMTGSRRMPYWRLHAEGDETRLGELGLK